MKLAPLTLLLLLVLTACAPGAAVISAPTFAVVAEGSGLVRLEPPGVGRGAAVFRLQIEATNPNPIPIRLAGFDGHLSLADRRVASSRFTDGISLPAAGTGRLVLDIEAPLAEAPHLIGQMALLLTGASVPYQVDGTVSVDVFGAVQRFPSITVARGEMRAPGPLRVPDVRIDPAASRIRLEGLTAVVEVGLEIGNPTFLGYLVRGPQLELRLDGRSVGRASIPETPVPAFGDATALVRVEAGLAQLGAALAAQVQGGGVLEVVVDGDLVFEVPGVVESRLPLAGISGRVR